MESGIGPHDGVMGSTEDVGVEEVVVSNGTEDV